MLGRVIPSVMSAETLFRFQIAEKYACWIGLFRKVILKKKKLNFDRPGTYERISGVVLLESKSFFPLRQVQEVEQTVGIFFHVIFHMNLQRLFAKIYFFLFQMDLASYC